MFSISRLFLVKARPANFRARLACEQLGDRIVPNATLPDAPEAPPAAGPGAGAGLQPPPVIPPPVVPPAVLPTAGPGAFEKIEDITGPARKDTPRRTRPGDPPSNPTAGSLLDEFEKAGGKVESGESPTGGHITFPAKPGDPPRIVIDPTKVKDKGDAIAVLIFELIRFKYQAEQQALIKKTKEGGMTPDEYAVESERLAYKYVKLQHQIVLNGTSNGRYDIVTDRYEAILTRYPTFEEYLQAQKDSKHYDHSRDKAEGWQKGKPPGNETADPADVDPEFNVGGAGGDDVDPGFAAGGPGHVDVDPHFGVR